LVYSLPEALPRPNFLVHEAEPHPRHHPAEPSDEVIPSGLGRVIN